MWIAPCIFNFPKLRILSAANTITQDFQRINLKLIANKRDTWAVNKIEKKCLLQNVPW